MRDFESYLIKFQDLDSQKYLKIYIYIYINKKIYFLNIYFKKYIKKYIYIYYLFIIIYIYIYKYFEKYYIFSVFISDDILFYFYFLYMCFLFLTIFFRFCPYFHVIMGIYKVIGRCSIALNPEYVAKNASNAPYRNVGKQLIMQKLCI